MAGGEKMIDTMMPLEQVIIPKPIISPKSYDWVGDEVEAIIIRADKHDFDLCGKTMLDWVKIACAGIETQVIDEPSDEQFISTIALKAEGKKIVIVLYSDTPLLQRQTILSVLDYFSSHPANTMSLPRGYVFNVDYLLRTKEIISPAHKNFSPDEFEIISTPEQIGKAYQTLQHRIRAYHKSNGVILKGEQTIFIDADVQIEKGVVIDPNNVLAGESVIEENVRLKSGNYIENSVIKSGSVLQGKTIVDGQER